MPPVTTTTTPKPTTTTPKPTTTTTTTTTTPKPTTTEVPTTTTNKVPPKRKRDVKDVLEWSPQNLIESIRPESIAGAATFTTTPTLMTITNKIRILQRAQHPFVCNNQTDVMPDPKKTYGYFKREIIVQSKFLKIKINISILY